jgi:hypothetical protein
MGNSSYQECSKWDCSRRGTTKVIVDKRVTLWYCKKHADELVYDRKGVRVA